MLIYRNYNNGERVQQMDNSADIEERGPFGWMFRIILFIALFFAVFVTVGLAGYHIYLGCTNQTTYEMIKPQIIESYIKDEIKRKKKYLRRKEKRKIKQLKKAKAKEIEREQELKKQQIELQKQIDLIEEIINDDEKYQNKEDDNDDNDDNNDDDDDESDESETETESSDDSSDDASSMAEKVLLFEPKQRKSPKFKRAATPIKNNINGNKSRKRFISNYRDEYRNYFDEGWIANVYIFLSGKMHPEWKTPLPCIVLPKRPPDDDEKK